MKKRKLYRVIDLSEIEKAKRINPFQQMLKFKKLSTYKRIAEDYSTVIRIEDNGSMYISTIDSNLIIHPAIQRNEYAEIMAMVKDGCFQSDTDQDGKLIFRPYSLQSLDLCIIYINESENFMCNLAYKNEVPFINL